VPDRIVVTNSTPVIALSSIYRLELLKDLYGEIIIPKAVHDEVMAKKDSVSQLALVQANDWIITKTVINSQLQGLCPQEPLPPSQPSAPW
jgi:predicted nucleic acid-binding protein